MLYGPLSSGYLHVSWTTTSMNYNSSCLQMRQFGLQNRIRNGCSYSIRPKLCWGTPLQWSLSAFYSGTKTISEFNHFSSLVIISGFFKCIFECFFTSEHDKCRFKIRQALERWCRESDLLSQAAYAFFPASSTGWEFCFIDYRLSYMAIVDTYCIT